MDSGHGNGGMDGLIEEQTHFRKQKKHVNTPPQKNNTFPPNKCTLSPVMLPQ